MELVWFVIIIPEINNSSIKRIEIVTSKILKGLAGDFIVTSNFAIGHSFRGIFYFNWGRYDVIFVEHLALADRSSMTDDSSIGLMLLKTFSKYLQKTSPVSSSDLVNEPSGLRSFEFRGFEWWPQKPLFIRLTASQDIKAPPLQSPRKSSASIALL